MVKIVSDSSSLYTTEEGQKVGLTAIPLCINIGDLQGRDLQIDMAEFYERIQKGQIPTSSQPPIGEVLEVYEVFADADIINITMADGLSGTYQTACAAKEMAANKDHITVFNSMTLCGPQRYLVDHALEMEQVGSGVKEIVDWLETASKKSESFLIPQDFSFLRRGGRLTPVAATVGSLLKLKPILQLTKDGMRLDKFGIKRTMTSAVSSIIKYLGGVQLGEQHLMYISHADAYRDAIHIKELFETAFPKLEVRLLELGAAFVTQGGPQCIAIQYIER
ncbi:MAG: DegV family protein [Hungatella sp.]